MVKSAHLTSSCLRAIKTTLDEDIIILPLIKSAINDYII